MPPAPGTYQIDDFRLAIPWLAGADSSMPDETWLELQAWIRSNPEGWRRAYSLLFTKEPRQLVYVALSQPTILADQFARNQAG